MNGASVYRFRHVVFLRFGRVLRLSHYPVHFEGRTIDAIPRVADAVECDSEHMRLGLLERNRLQFHSAEHVGLAVTMLRITPASHAPRGIRRNSQNHRHTNRLWDTRVSTVTVVPTTTDVLMIR